MKIIKKLPLILGLFMATGLAGCGGSNPTTAPSSDPTSSADPTTVEPTTVDPTVDPTTDPTTVDPTVDPTTVDPTVDPTTEPTTAPTEDKFDVILHCSNVIDGQLQGLSVLIDGVEVGKTDTTGTITVTDVTEHTVIQIESEDYETEIIDDLPGTVELNVDMKKIAGNIGRLVTKTWANYEEFSTQVTRSKDGIVVRHLSNNNIFTSEGRNSKLETYISVGDNVTSRDGNAGVTQYVITSAGDTSTHNYGGLDVAGITSDVYVTDTSTFVEIVFPYDSLGITSDEIIGISAGLWSEVDKDWAPMWGLETEVLAAVETPSAYIRTDKDNYCFFSSINDYPPQIEYDREALIQGKPYGIAHPDLVKMPAADDINFSVTPTETGFEFDMVGFGTFEDNEYIKFVFHTSDTNGGGWAIQASDLSVLVSKTQAKYRTGLTDFWSYTNFGNDTATNHQPVYNLHDSGYFTLTWELDYTEIPEYSADGKVSLIGVEFGNGIIYNNDPWINAMTYNGVGIGDPAAQSSYVVIKDKDIGVDKDAMIAEYDIKFSNICYAKFDKSSDGLKLSLLSFNQLSDTDFIRFVVDTDGVGKTGVWAIDSSDVSFTIYKDKAYIETGKTDFWDGEMYNFHASNNETLNTVEYNNETDYWTLDLLIDWTELGLNISENSSLRGLLLLFNPEIQNLGFDYYGKTNVGDQAIQTNYFTI